MNMKQTAFLLKSLLMVTMMGWTLMSNAQRYEIDHGRVFFGDEVMMQADAQSFVDLGSGYAKDRINVYLNGHVLEYVDPSTFRLKEHFSRHHHGHKVTEESAPAHRGYYKTNFNVYYGNKKIDAMASTFVELSGGYAKDSFNVYYFGEKLKGCMASTFEILEGGYAKDSFSVFYRGNKVDGAMASTFKYTGNGYGEDIYNAFYKGKKLK
jgi:hypothetical protein